MKPKEVGRAFYGWVEESDFGALPEQSTTTITYYPDGALPLEQAFRTPDEGSTCQSRRQAV